MDILSLYPEHELHDISLVGSCMLLQTRAIDEMTLLVVYVL